MEPQTSKRTMSAAPVLAHTGGRVCPPCQRSPPHTNAAPRPKARSTNAATDHAAPSILPGLWDQSSNCLGFSDFAYPLEATASVLASPRKLRAKPESVTAIVVTRRGLA